MWYKYTHVDKHLYNNFFVSNIGFVLLRLSLLPQVQTRQQHGESCGGQHRGPAMESTLKTF